MKKLKLGILAFLAGQLVVLIFKDKETKEKLVEVKSLDQKIKLLFNEIIDLNKDLFDKLKFIGNKETFEDLNIYFDYKMGKIGDFFKLMKDKINDLGEKQLKPMIDNIEQEIKSLRDKLDSGVKNIEEKLDIQKKIDYLSEKLSYLKSKISGEKKKDEDNKNNNLPEL